MTDFQPTSDVATAADLHELFGTDFDLTDSIRACGGEWRRNGEDSWQWWRGPARDD